MSDDKATIEEIRRDWAWDGLLRNAPYLPEQRLERVESMLRAISSLLAAIDRRDAEIAKLRECANKVSDALTDIESRTCGGASHSMEKVHLIASNAICLIAASFPKPEVNT